MRSLRCLTLLLGVGAFTGSAQAGLLNLQLLYPDIASTFVQASYDANTDQFLATGIAQVLEYDGVAPPDFDIVGGTFNLSATIDDMGTPLGGSLTITGSVNGLGPTLLTADVFEIGFLDPPGGDLFEFRLNLTGGDLFNDFNTGQPLGVILAADNTFFDGTWDTSFTGGILGLADTSPEVPEPATALLLLAGAAVAIRRRVR